MARVCLTYIVSDIDKALALEWLADALENRYAINFIIIGKEGTFLEKYLYLRKISCHVVSDSTYQSNLSKWVKVYSLLRSIKPDIVHTHLWRANLIGLTVAWLLGIPQRVFTRHHGMVHYDEYPSGRKWDIMCNKLATDIVAISRNVWEILVYKDKAKREKIHLIHHGFKLSYFSTVLPEAVLALRLRYNVPEYKTPVIGVIARYEKWKGVQYAIEAFKYVQAEHSNAHLVLANAQGSFNNEVRAMLNGLPIGSYTEVEHEPDLAALYRLFDVYVHVPVDSQSEAFGQTYVEALAAGVPSVFTLSGVASEFIRDGHNARVVNYKDASQIKSAINEIIVNRDATVQMIEIGRKSITTFTVENMVNKLSDMYG